MTISITPYLQFDGDAREAMEFYHSVFGGELTMTTFGEGMGDTADAESASRIMHASLYVEPGFHLMASDTAPGMPPARNGVYSLSSDGTNAADDEPLRGYWEKLAADGAIDMPMEVAPWGDAFGQVTDKFGISWFVNVTAAQR
ncbi:VOC family protein [Tessaracoccus sp. OS52]|uniref:VOC family protein n=1 Tax=Tessaracoccus sp. OS52 TaxID=2886691 RepID=UPI001D10C4EA|nr:VOC family protein [Tessaracoccus sp. OS52]MCC2593702.1 VOC family protein [Tessaracoccus sp. OS52]